MFYAFIKANRYQVNDKPLYNNEGSLLLWDSGRESWRRYAAPSNSTPLYTPSSAAGGISWHAGLEASPLVGSRAVVLLLLRGLIVTHLAVCQLRRRAILAIQPLLLQLLYCCAGVATNPFFLPLVENQIG